MRSRRMRPFYAPNRQLLSRAAKEKMCFEIEVTCSGRGSNRFRRHFASIRMRVAARKPSDGDFSELRQL